MKVWRASLLAICITSGCGGLSDLPGAKLLEVREEPDKSLTYRFRNGASCNKRADHTEFIKTGGAIAIKSIFELKGDFENKWEHAKQFSPKFQELESVFFEICYEYGEERLPQEQYQEERKIYTRLRERLLGGAAIPSITQVVPVKLTSNLSGTEVIIDITVRNPSPEVIQLDQMRLDFYGPRGSALAAVTEISNTYTVLLDPTLSKPIVQPTPNSKDRYPAYAWFPAECADRFIVKSPIWQTIKPNDVDRFLLKVVFPEHACLKKARFDRARVEIVVNGSETMKSQDITIK